MIVPLQTKFRYEDKVNPYACLILKNFNITPSFWKEFSASYQLSDPKVFQPGVVSVVTADQENLTYKMQALTLMMAGLELQRFVKIPSFVYLKSGMHEIAGAEAVAPHDLQYTIWENALVKDKYGLFLDPAVVFFARQAGFPFPASDHLLRLHDHELAKIHDYCVSLLQPYFSEEKTDKRKLRRS